MNKKKLIIKKKKCWEFTDAFIDDQKTTHACLYTARNNVVYQGVKITFSCNFILKLNPLKIWFISSLSLCTAAISNKPTTNTRRRGLPQLHGIILPWMKMNWG